MARRGVVERVAAAVLHQVTVVACPDPKCGGTVELRGAPLVEQVACPACERPIPLAVYRYCPCCGGELIRQLDYEGRNRLVCSACAFLFELNPILGVAVVLIENERVLLARRRYTDTAGMWCIPCGKVEPGEDVHEAARREFREETGPKVELIDPIFVDSSLRTPHRPVLGVWFSGRVVGGELAAGDEVQELAFFPLDAPPADLAFEGDRMVIDKLRQGRPGATEEE